MAKSLRDVAPKAPKKGEFTGVNKSKTEPADISDFVPDSASGNRDFAKKHKIEKHEYPHGDEAFTSGKVKGAPYKKQDQKVYESMKCESCGKAYEGESCGCGSKVPQAGDGKRGIIADKKKLDEDVEQIDELSKETMKSYVKKAGVDKRDSEMKSKVYSKLANTLDPQSPKEASEVRAKGHEHYVNAKKRGEGIKLAKKKLQEVLTKKTPVSKVISDFVKSDAPTFSRDSKKQRIKRALGAYYNMHKEEALDEVSTGLAHRAAIKAWTKSDLMKSDAKKDPDIQSAANTMLKASKKNQQGNKFIRYAQGMKEETAEGYGPKERGIADGYAGRKPDPHKYITNQDGSRKRVQLTDPKEIKQYMAGHNDDNYGNKVYEDLAMPMLEGGKKKKTRKESAPGETPMRFPSGDVGDIGRV
jgi:hypothetical protein